MIRFDLILIRNIPMVYDNMRTKSSKTAAKVQKKNRHLQINADFFDDEGLGVWGERQRRFQVSNLRFQISYLALLERSASPYAYLALLKRSATPYKFGLRVTGNSIFTLNFCDLQLNFAALAQKMQDLLRFQTANRHYIHSVLASVGILPTGKYH